MGRVYMQYTEKIGKHLLNTHISTRCGSTHTPVTYTFDAWTANPPEGTPKDEMTEGNAQLGDSKACQAPNIQPHPLRQGGSTV